MIVRLLQILKGRKWHDGYEAGRKAGWWEGYYFVIGLLQKNIEENRRRYEKGSDGNSGRGIEVHHP